jgi:dihydrofolate synthase/folylpolyglutamate synthase
MSAPTGGVFDGLFAEFGWDRLSPASSAEKKAAFAALLAAEGGPPAELRVVKVLGTNGKGSVAAMLEACLREDGLRTGLFTSPHLERVTERIRVGGAELDGEWERHVRDLLPLLRRFRAEHGPRLAPTFFQTLLLTALRAFREARTEVAVVEAGVGGVTDITSVLPDVLAVITSVGWDHEDRLGRSLEEIALNKAGGASDGSTLVLGPGVPAPARAAIHAVHGARLARIVEAAGDTVRLVERGKAGLVAHVRMGGAWRSVRLPLPGAFQLENLATAAAALNEMSRLGLVRSSACLRGVEAVRWPGRFEHRPGPPEVVLDAAHNEHAMRALCDSLQAWFPDRARLLVFGASQGKAVHRYAPTLGRIAGAAWIVDGFHHAVPRAELEAEIGAYVPVAGACARVDDALDAAFARAGETGALVVVAGSVFLVGKAREALRARGI